jgi:hypothetical protein
MVAAEVSVDSTDDNGQRPSSVRNGTVLMRKRLRSDSRSSHESEDLQKQFGGRTATMNDQAQKMTDLIDRELKEWSQNSATLTTSPNLHNTKRTTKKRFPDPGWQRLSLV